MMCSPADSDCSTAAMAACPDENANADSPPSSAASAASQLRRLGLLMRVYISPLYSPPASRSKVVASVIDGVTALLPGSTARPAWTISVSSFMLTPELRLNPINVVLQFRDTGQRNID